MITSAGGSGASWAAISSGVRAKTSGVPTRRAVSRMRATKKRSRTTATTFIGWASAARLVVLLLVAEPVAVPLGQMREGGEVPHPVEVDPAVQVVGLVLDDAGEELLGHHVDQAALAVERLETHAAEARDHAPHVGHREAALPAVLHLLGQRGHHRVDQHRERDRGGVGVARVAVHLDHADLLELVHLGSGEPGSVVLAHGLDHVVDQALGPGRADLLDRNGRRELAKYRVSETRDLQDGHGVPSRSDCSTGPRARSTPARTLRHRAAYRDSFSRYIRALRRSPGGLARSSAVSRN